MKSLTKVLCLVLCLAMMTAVFAGCNGSKDSGGKGNPNQQGSSNGVNPEDYRGTTVKYATWKNPYHNEDGIVVDSFQKKYGIKVEIVTVPQATYVHEIQGLIASGNSPDVFFETKFFPGSLSCLQPVSAMKLDMTDPIWDATMFEKSTINGNAYLVNTVGNIWSEADCVYYNKRIFADNNITTPEEYVKAGKWTFAAFEKCMKDLKNAGYLGAYIDVEALLASTGSGFYRFEDGKFSNAMDTRAVEVLTKVATWTSDGLIRKVTELNLTNNFKIGKAGMAVIDAFGLKATGYWRDMNTKEIGYTFMPDFDENNKRVVSSVSRAWGSIRGSKNPVAAGIFLRYYLDVNNYDLDSAFISEDAQEFFFKLTSMKTDKKLIRYIDGVCTLTGEHVYNDYTTVATYAPAQVAGRAATLKNTIDANVNRINSEIEKQVSSFEAK